MSLEQIREENIKKVTKKALEMFEQDGIEKTKVSDVAAAVNLTERSVFRYFPTKIDLVLASASMFWKELSNSSLITYNSLPENLSGIEQFECILKTYAHQLFKNKRKLVFVQETEVYLFRNNKKLSIREKPVNNLEEAEAPLAYALKKGIQDQSIINIDINIFYQTVFNALLGFMQKLACDIYDGISNDDEKLIMLDKFCEIFVNTIKK